MKPLVLTREQHDAVRGKLADVLTGGSYTTPVEWRLERLGLPADFGLDEEEEEEEAEEE